MSRSSTSSPFGAPVGDEPFGAPVGDSANSGNNDDKSNEAENLETLMRASASQLHVPSTRDKGLGDSVTAPTPQCNGSVTAPSPPPSWKCQDFRWCLFVAALRSYRWATTLKPFPNQFRFNEGASVEEEMDDAEYQNLVRQSNGISCGNGMSNGISNGMSNGVSNGNACGNQKSPGENGRSSCPLFPPSAAPQLPPLFNWMTARNSTFKMSALPNTEEAFKEICRQVGQTSESSLDDDAIDKPQHIFQIEYQQESTLCKRFDRLKSGVEDPEKDVVLAFHGSPLENFHSILHFGLNGPLSKRGIFGDGIYLAGDIGLAFVFSASGAAWDGSLLGRGLRCVAACNVINRPGVTVSGKDKRGKGKVFDADEVPVQYYVVKNSDAVQLKYILVYVEGKTSRAETLSTRRGRSRDDRLRRVVAWVRSHGLLTVLLIYGLLLLFVGTDFKFWSRIWRRS